MAYIYAILPLSKVFAFSLFESARDRSIFFWKDSNDRL